MPGLMNGTRNNNCANVCVGTGFQLNKLKEKLMTERTKCTETRKIELKVPRREWVFIEKSIASLCSTSLQPLMSKQAFAVEVADLWTFRAVDFIPNVDIQAKTKDSCILTNAPE